MWAVIIWLTALSAPTCGLVKFEPGVRFKEIRTTVQSSSIAVKYTVDMQARHAMDATMEIDRLQQILIRDGRELNDSIIQTCNLMKDAHRQLETHYDTIVKKATLLRRRRATNPLAFVGDILGWCCSIATQGDLSVALENDVLIQNQLDLLFNSFDNVLNVTRQNTNQWAEFAKDIHEKFQIVDERLAQALTSNAELVSDWFTHVILRSVSSMTEMVVKLLMAERLDQIYESCTQNMIPLSVMPPDMLLTEIESLNKQMYPRAEVAIASISALYKLKIVNCVFSPNSLEIIVKFPVKNINSDWKILDVLPVPFAYKNYVCKILPVPVMILSNNTHVRLLSEQQRNDCLQNSVCPLPRATSISPAFGRCLEQLYFGRLDNYANLNNSCRFKCVKSYEIEIVDLGLNDYVIVHPKDELVIQCPASEVAIQPVPIGASRINIPCDCILISNSTILIEVQYPCDPRLSNELSKTIILPALWSDSRKISPIAGTKFDHTYVNVRSVLSKDLSLVLPEFVTISDGPKQPTKKVSHTLPSANMGLYAFCSIILILQIVLFTLIGVLFKINCCKQKAPIRKPAPRQRQRRHSTESAIELDLFRTRYAARV